MMLFSQKGGFLDDKNVILVLLKNLHNSKGVDLWFRQKIPNIFQAYVSVKETLVLWLDDVVCSKGDFLENKNVIFL